MTLAPNQSKTYAFKFFKVANENAVKDKLYSEGLVDVTVVPGMIFSTNMKAKVDLRTSKAITSVTAQYPAETTINFLNSAAGGHNIYELTLGRLGPNNITVNYGNGEKTVLQFYAIEPIDAALQRHSTFMVNSTQWNAPGQLKDKVFDDWMMDTKAKRNVFNGYWGWGDDWGYTHGQFLAEKNVQTPVASEITAVDQYLETAIWNSLMATNHSDYLIYDFLMPAPNTTPTYRGYAYPHIYNTYFSMYKIAKLYPDTTTYIHPRNTYLLRAYNIFKALYDGPVAYNWNTGLMGELTTPEIIKALQDEGYTTQANDVIAKMATKYNNFKNTTYPYGSEYNYDNTGEEAVYTLAKMNNNTTMKSKINAKPRRARTYADLVLLCGSGDHYGRELVELPVHRLLGGLRDGRLDSQSFRDAGGRAADVLRREDRQRRRDQLRPDQLRSGEYRGGGMDLSSGKRQLWCIGTRRRAVAERLERHVGRGGFGLVQALKILSSDVAVDPIFGLYCYGCDVASSGGNYTVIPKDGVFQRLNLITEKFGMELERDKYTAATVAIAKNSVNFTLKNSTPGAAHTTKVTFTGLAPGSYNILVNNAAAGTVNVTSGNKATISLNVGTAATYDVKLQQGTPPANTAPVVNAGTNATFTLPASVVLAGTVTDDGLPSGTVTTTWSLQSGPGTATFANAGAANTTATVSVAGTYVFKLTASDGSLSSSATVTHTVNPALLTGSHRELFV